MTKLWVPLEKLLVGRNLAWVLGYPGSIGGCLNIPPLLLSTPLRRGMLYTAWEGLLPQSRLWLHWGLPLVHAEGTPLLLSFMSL